MLADQAEEPADSRILDHFGIDDLDKPSLKQYRQRFAARSPDSSLARHWTTEAFMDKLGGWRKDRTTGQEGLTVAGLLMFGKDEAIRDPAAIPEYHLDYREKLSDDPSVRWTDRLTIDGTWVANLFQFYQRVIQRLTADLKIPFQLGADLFRKDDTIVHEAIREALVNALIHADYRGQGGIVIEKYRDRFELSNPGLAAPLAGPGVVGGRQRVPQQVAPDDVPDDRRRRESRVRHRQDPPGVAVSALAAPDHPGAGPARPGERRAADGQPAARGVAPAASIPVRS